jgi:hypothetical protein
LTEYGVLGDAGAFDIVEDGSEMRRVATSDERGAELKHLPPYSRLP